MSAAGPESDLTRKQRREQARTERKAAEEAARKAADRKRRLALLGGIAAGAAVIIVVIVLATGGGGSSSSKGLATGTQANQNVSAVNTQLTGLPQSGNALGSPSAPVTMTYYGDLECPVCQTFTLGTLPQVLANYVHAGKLRIEYHSLQTATQDPGTFQTQQTAALAAGKQAKMWQYLELFYREQGPEGSGYVTEGYLDSLANQVPGLNVNQWRSERNDPTLTQQITQDAQNTTKAGLNSTPSLVVSGPRGTKTLVGNVPYGTVAQAIQSVA